MLSPASNRISSAIAAAQGWATAHTVCCRIHLNPNAAKAIYRCGSEHSVTSFSVTSTRDLEILRDQEIDSVLVDRPQTSDELLISADNSYNFSLLWTIDHYVHAEHLAATNRHKTQHVLIQLQTPQPGPGVRPGTDAIQLAQGVQRLSGIRIAGLVVHVSAGDDVPTMLETLRHTRQAILKRGICCDTVSMSSSVNVLPSVSFPLTELNASVGSTRGDLITNNAVQTATVISRPSLAHVVVVVDDIAAAGCRLTFPDYPHADIACWDHDCCVIVAAGAAVRLNIGDRLRVLVQH